VSGLVAADVQSAKLEWEDAHQDLVKAAHDPARQDDLRRQLEAVMSELRRRLGGTFTLRELTNEYARADVWVRDALAESEVPGWPRTMSLVEGAAFHLYSRGAVDYAP
jgi:alcohol dehydrogenase class IV